MPRSRSPPPRGRSRSPPRGRESDRDRDVRERDRARDRDRERDRPRYIEREDRSELCFIWPYGPLSHCNLDPARTMCVPPDPEVAAGGCHFFYRIHMSNSTLHFPLYTFYRSGERRKRYNASHTTLVPPPSHSTPPRYDDDRERERERRAVELDDRGATARRQELRRQDKEDEEAEASEKHCAAFSALLFESDALSLHSQEGRGRGSW
jgi:hypothetical protein